MKKSIKKIVLLVMILSVFFTCFMITASAATGTGSDINGSKCDFIYDTVKSTATLTKSANSSQTWKLPSSVSCKVGGSYPYFTVTALDSNFFVKSGSYASSIHTLRLPSTLKTIQNGLFQSGIGYLKTLEIYGAETTCEDYFLGCTALKEFIVNENNPNMKAVDGVLYSDTELMRFPSAKTLTDTTTYEISEEITSIRAYAFYKAKNIENVYVPASVTAVGSAAFCSSNIEGIHFEDGSTYDFSAYKCNCGGCAEKFCLEDEESVAPTCTAPGHTAGLRCDITGEWFSGEELPMADHSFTVFSEEKPATCTEDAVRIYKCEFNCGETDEKAIPDSATGHNGGKATCVAAAVCESCGDSYGAVDSDGHAFAEYKYNDDATCKADGTQTAVCANGCGQTDTVKVEGTILPHSASAPVVSGRVAPTCDKAGSYAETVSCLVCSEVLSSVTKTVPALGHADGNGDNICDNGGEKLRSPEDDCTHLCHKTGFMGFIWKIIRFFQKLFKMNPVCECGAAHY